MATAPFRARHEGRRSHPGGWRLWRAVRSIVAATSRAATTRLARSFASRGHFPRLGMLGVPLAIVAALLAAQWWAVVPLTVCAWQWAPCDWGWEWVVAIQLGGIGTVWAVAGVIALSARPDDPISVGSWWIAIAVMMAVLGEVNRRSGQQAADRTRSH